MYREKLEELKKWKENKNKKILLIKGAKFVGKTYIAKKFAEENYTTAIYIKCTNDKDKIEYQIINTLKNEIIEKETKQNKDKKETQEQNLDQNEIKIKEEEETNLYNQEENKQENLKTEKLPENRNLKQFIIDKKQNENAQLVIIDNIEENIELIEQIKYFDYKQENIDIIVITSIWGNAIKENYTLENKNIESITIKPLNYNEFLQAIGEEELAKKLKKLELKETQKMQEIQEIQELKAKYTNNLKKYIYIGGMPEIVLKFAKNKDYKEVRELQKEMLKNYIKNLEEIAPQLIIGEIKSTIKNIPIQLKKEDKRFVCKEIDKWAKEWQYDAAINWLLGTGLIYKIEKIEKPEIPLVAYRKSTHYKLFFLDIGMLSAMIDLDLAVILESNKIFNMNNMQLSNQFIFQELSTQITTPIYYWQQEKYLHNIDFIMQNQGKVYSYKMDTINKEDNKDLWIYHYQYKKYDCFRIKVSDFCDKGWYIDTPLYMIENIRKIHE